MKKPRRRNTDMWRNIMGVGNSDCKQIVPRLQQVLVLALAVSVDTQGVRGGRSQSSSGRTGGGGGGGRSSSSYRHRSSSSSSSSSSCRVLHCSSCEWHDNHACSSCISGYTLSADGRQCLSCAANCRTCDTAGPGSCEVGGCRARHTTASSGLCEPCAANCVACANAGPGSCDAGACASGTAQVRDSWTGHPTCPACASGCAECTGTAGSECTSCRWFYSFYPGTSPAEAGCKLVWGQVVVFAAIVAALVSQLARLAREQARARPRPPPGAQQVARPREVTDTEHRAFISGGEAEERRAILAQPRADADEAQAALVVASPYPSGAWRGCYKQTPARRGEDEQHGVCEFQLRFAGDGTVGGAGTDDVGAYTVNGRHGGGRIAFTKRYGRGSRNAAGYHNPENLGHSVEYRGSPARLDAEGRPLFGRGLRGNWWLKHRLGDDEGQWHLWPVMRDWEQWEPAAEPAAGGAGGRPPAAAAADEEVSECCVCYDAPIDTCLEPCGHVAMCSGCVARLPRPRRCPLCRAAIERVTSVDV